MTIPAAPLPDLSALFRGLSAEAPSDGAPWLAGGSARRAIFFSRASMALASAAFALRGEDPSGSWRLWVPEYFCEEALGSIRRSGVSLRFYAVKEDLSPDLPRDLAGPGALLAVHYFGFPNASAATRDACRAAGLTLIEDAAHVLMPQEGVGASSWTIYSPRKLLALPAGGILICPEVEAARIPPAAPAAPAESGGTVLWALRRLAQAALRTGRIPWRQGEAVAAVVDSGEAPRSLSTFERRLLAVAAGRLADAARRRRENFLAIHEWAAEHKEFRPMRTGLPEDVCPYAYPFLAAEAARVVSGLRARGVPAYRWPDLPPEARGAVARRLAAETVLLPVHQSLLPRELRRMRTALKEVFS